jgi:small-conductance mechanosensitive channel
MVDDIRMALEDFGNTVQLDKPAVRILLILAFTVLLQAVIHMSVDRLVERAVRRHKHTNRQEEHKREATLKTFFRTTTSVALWIVSAILVLIELNLNLSALLTSAGLIGVVAGIGGQNVIKDCLAGLFIILENQLRVDDIVKISTPTATIAGQVEEVTIRTTRLRDLDGNLHIMTNGSIGVITNMSYSFAQVNLDILVSYDTDIDLVERLIHEAGQLTAANKELKADILEPIEMLRVDKLGESTVTIKALGKVKPGVQWTVAGEFRRHLKKLFDKHKIPAPYASIILRQAKDTKK